MALGIYEGLNNSDSGGNYRPGKGRGQPQPKFHGHELPSWMSHTPIGVAYTLGLDIGRSFREGAGASGAAKQLTTDYVTSNPVVDFSGMLTDIKEGNPNGVFMGLAQMIPPQLIQDAARMSDKGKDPQMTWESIIDYIISPVKRRKPTNVLQSLYTGIPGLRQQVPEPTPK